MYYHTAHSQSSKKAHTQHTLVLPLVTCYHYLSIILVIYQHFVGAKETELHHRWSYVSHTPTPTVKGQKILNALLFSSYLSQKQTTFIKVHRATSNSFSPSSFFSLTRPHFGTPPKIRVSLYCFLSLKSTPARLQCILSLSRNQILLQLVIAVYLFLSRTHQPFYFPS